MANNTSFPRVVIATVVAFLAFVETEGQVDPPEFDSLYPWAYSAGFGTGTYTFGNERVIVFRVEPKVPLRALSRGKVATTLLLPFTIGFQEFDLGDFGSLDDIFERLRTVTFVPGVEVEIPMGGTWTLKPYGHFGGGTTQGFDESAWIYYFGVNSRVGLPSVGAVEVYMINSLEFFRQNPSTGPSNGYTALVTGFEGIYKMGSMMLFERQLFFKPHIAHHWYFDPIDFSRPLRDTVELKQEFEVALAVGFEERISFKVWGFDRLGIAYRWGKDTSGVRIFFSSIFL